MVELNNPTVSDKTESGALNMVKLTIDNCEVVVPEHTTILGIADGEVVELVSDMGRDRVRVVFAGRLGGYKYYDMDKAIAAAFELVRKELGVEPTEA